MNWRRPKLRETAMACRQVAKFQIHAIVVDITGGALDLAVPNVGSTSQQSVLSQAVRYGGQRGVTVNVIPYP
jgi:hypothetical protein